MKALILTMTSAFLVLITVLAIANLQLLMQLGAIQLPGLEINLSLMLFYTLVALAMSGGLYVLWADAKESRDEIRKSLSRIKT